MEKVCIEKVDIEIIEKTMMIIVVIAEIAE